MRRYAVLAAATAALVLGCASSPTVEELTEELTARVDGRLNSAMGLSEHELIDKIGVPHNSYAFADGSRALEYQESEFLSAIGTTITCKISIDVDGRGTVSGWKMPAGANLYMCARITDGLR